MPCFARWALRVAIKIRPSIRLARHMNVADSRI
jgi:hypothetical protein